MEVSTVTLEDRQAIDKTVTRPEADVGTLLDRVGAALSGITHGERAPCADGCLDLPGQPARP